MSTTETIPVQPETLPEVTPVVDPQPELPEQRYEWQPTDDSGRPLGNKQVVKYRTQEEFAQKFSEANTLLIRKLREETRKNRLGIVDDEEISDESPRLDVLTEFKARELSPEQRYQLSQDLLDPTKFTEATTTLFEATLGASPEVLRSTLANVQASNLNLLAKVESEAFVQGNADYYKCAENKEAITNWMVRHNLQPVRANFQKAYDTLKAAGIMLSAPLAPAPTVLPVVEAPPIPAQAPPEPPVARIPTGLSRSVASDAAPAPAPTGEDIVYNLPLSNGQVRTLRGQAAIDAMPAEDYRRRLLGEKGFAEKVNKIEADRRK